VNADEIVTPLARTTTARRVAETLRDHILSGRLAPGTPLRETQLSASLGVSRNTLREALRGLAEQGLVTHRPHHGVVVTDLTEDDVADLYRLRSVVELAALPAIATNAEGLERLQVSILQFGRALARHDYVGALEHDFGFHGAIVAALGSRRIDETYARAQAELRPALLRLDSVYADPSQVADHRRIHDALREQRVRRASELLDRHLRNAQTHVQELLRERSAA
jgi:DNA-binding GntR family transcriptional regulator